MPNGVIWKIADQGEASGVTFSTRIGGKVTKEISQATNFTWKATNFIEKEASFVKKKNTPRVTVSLGLKDIIERQGSLVVRLDANKR